MDKQFPAGMEPLAGSSFSFACHQGVSCYTRCCKDVDLTLYPYDIVCVKNALNIDSEDFLRKHTFLVRGDNPFFPTVKLRLTEDELPACPFLSDAGCGVYASRPSACRTYPLERAVDRELQRGKRRDFYFITRHPYCKGHEEAKENSVKNWCREQQLHQHNIMNDLWAEMDTLFASNPWKGEGAGGEKQQIAFMCCYNIDGFRRFVQQHSLLKRFRLSSRERQQIMSDDTQLLKFSFQWLVFFLTGKSSSLMRR